MGTLGTSEIATALIKRGSIENETAQQTAAISQGNYREALQLLQNASEDWQSLLREWLNAALKNGPSAQTKWIDLRQSVITASKYCASNIIYLPFLYEKIASAIPAIIFYKC